VTWILRIYPPAWRRRYGEEFLELVGAQRLSLALIVDIIAGAVDAWIHPQRSSRPNATKDKEDRMTVERTLRLSCSGYGSTLTARDRFKCVAATLGSVLVLTPLWIWLRLRMPENVDTLSLSPMTFFAPYFIGMKYTYLKDRSATTQLLIIGGAIAVFTGFFLAIGRLAELL
jgi:hypothetical protein